MRIIRKWLRGRAWPGQFFGFASMLEANAHQTALLEVEECACVEVDREDIAVMLERKQTCGG